MPHRPGPSFRKTTIELHTSNIIRVALDYDFVLLNLRKTIQPLIEFIFLALINIIATPSKVDTFYMNRRIDNLSSTYEGKGQEKQQYDRLRKSHSSIY